MKPVLTLIYLTCLFMLNACSTVTIKPQGTQQLTIEPSYEERLPYYLFGTVGEHHINVRGICGHGEVAQIQAQDTFMDRVLGIATIGIYRPRTAKVWCTEPQHRRG